MNESGGSSGTDAAWDEWGRRDPYFGVITNPKFRRSQLTDDAKREFFLSGELHAQHIITTLRQYVAPGFAPKSILDFGCGVGRLLPPFSTLAESVTGIDVSPAMLEEASRNCSERGLRNVRLLPSDDDLTTISGKFDLIHSCIVFQHIPIHRGRAIFSRLLQHLRPGGACAIHMTYSKTRFASNHGVAPPEIAAPASTNGPSVIPADRDPEIQMNPYNLNEILFLMQCRGVQNFHAEFSDHGGELGVFLFFSVSGTEIPL